MNFSYFIRIQYGLACHIYTFAAYLIFLSILTIMVTTYPSCIHDDIFYFYTNNNKTHCFDLINNSTDEILVIISFNNNYIFNISWKFQNTFKNYHLYEVFAAFCFFYSSIYLIFLPIIIIKDVSDSSVVYFRNIFIYFYRLTQKFLTIFKLLWD